MLDNDVDMETEKKEGKVEEDVMETTEQDEPNKSSGTLVWTLDLSEFNDTTFSPPLYVRNLPWRVMCIPRSSNAAGSERKPTLGFFLQCNPIDVQGNNNGWSCYARATLSILSREKPENDFNRRINHFFYAKENDWGYSNFMMMEEIKDPAKGFIKDNKVNLKIEVAADAPHGVHWDSKKYTGYVGLKNQGATCYMNSVLQTLYFTSQLRKAVYKMPTDGDDVNKSVALALQRVFYELQTSDCAVATKKLTKSFGWEALDSFMQHDVQEFCRVLLDHMENKMKGTCVEGTIPKLLEGKVCSYISCMNVDYESKRSESFFDIQLNIKGKRTVIESFEDYITPEILEGDNKYDAGTYGLQDAKKGTKFQKFPPVLYLQLMRFQYDPLMDMNVKINDRYEFPETLDLNEFIENPTDNEKFSLFAVLVHSGDNHGGHYVAYISPKLDGKWFKFDDDVVSKSNRTEAIENNFGGSEDESLNVRHCTNAYMLVYIKESQKDDVLTNIIDDDIPINLTSFFEEEKREEALRRKEKQEAHLYMSVEAVTDDPFHGYQGNDLLNWTTARPSVYRVKKESSVRDMEEMIADNMGYQVDGIRLWVFQSRANSTIRPAPIENEREKTIWEVAEKETPLKVFIETIDQSNPSKGLMPYKRDEQNIIFLKYFDVMTDTMYYLTHVFLSPDSCIGDVFQHARDKIGLPANVPLALYEEVHAGRTDELTPTKLLGEMEEVFDGDIWVIQRTDLTGKFHNTVDDYFRDLNNRISVQFCDKNNPADPGFHVVLNQKMTYNEVAEVVANCIDSEPNLIQFFKPQSHRDIAGYAIKSHFEGTLKDLFMSYGQRTKSPKKLFYLRLNIAISELESKDHFRCTWLNKHREETVLSLYVAKNVTISELLEEAKKQIELSPDGSAKLRLLEVYSYRIHRVFSNGVSYHNIQPSMAQQTTCYRVEEIPVEETRLGPKDFLIPVAHFHQTIFQCFNHPFLFKVTEGEALQSVRTRMLERFKDISEKEFEKYKFSLITHGRMTPLNDDFTFNSTDFITNVDKDTKPITEAHLDVFLHSRPWLGLEHALKPPKRSRYTYVEKPVKIHNQ